MKIVFATKNEGKVKEIKEMLEVAENDNLNIVEIKRESHSAKATGERPIFNEIIKMFEI